MVQVKKKRRKINKKTFIILIPLLVVLVLILFYCVYRHNIPNESHKDTFSPDKVVVDSTDIPSEEEVEDYKVADDMPRSIILKTIGIEGFIQRVGIDQNGNIAVPNNVHMAGWYVNSVKPGEVGLSIVTGHRDGVKKKGVFRYLGNLEKGDGFKIEYGDGALISFKVVDIQQVSVAEAYDLMYEKREDIERQLNLITCGGEYLEDEQTYDERIIVVSEGL